MWQLFACCLLLALAAALEDKVGADNYLVRVKEETVAAENTRKELAKGDLSRRTIERLGVAINSMKRSGDPQLEEAARRLEDGHINFKELQDYVAARVARRDQGAYSTILYFLDYAQKVHALPYVEERP